VSRFSIWLVSVLVVLATGCSHREPAQHEVLSFVTSAAAADAGRVVVLPFFAADGVGRSATVMSENTAACLRELGLHEVLLASNEQRDRLLPHDVVAGARMRADDLLAIRDQLHVDAVLIGRIEYFTSFDPISMGVTAALVSCHDGEVLWSATGHFDGHRQDIQDEIKGWYEATLSAQSNPISGWKVVLESPKLFTRYVAERLVQSIPVKKDEKNKDGGAHQ
jgi:hypothetical protein